MGSNRRRTGSSRALKTAARIFARISGRIPRLSSVSFTTAIAHGERTKGERPGEGRRRKDPTPTVVVVRTRQTALPPARRRSFRRAIVRPGDAPSRSSPRGVVMGPRDWAREAAEVRVGFGFGAPPSTTLLRAMAALTDRQRTELCVPFRRQVVVASISVSSATPPPRVHHPSVLEPGSSRAATRRCWSTSPHRATASATRPPRSDANWAPKPALLPVRGGWVVGRRPRGRDTGRRADHTSAFFVVLAGAGLLEKKWVSVLRLQKKVMDLEAKVKELEEEGKGGEREGRGVPAGKPDFLPRGPAKFVLAAHRMPVLVRRTRETRGFL